MTGSSRSDESSHGLDGQEVAAAGRQHAACSVRKCESQKDRAHALWVNDKRSRCVGK